MNEQLWQIKGSIEKFFYKTKINVALLRALGSQERTTFKTSVKTAIKQQLSVFTKKEVINRIIGLEKGMIDNPELLDGVIQNWLFLIAVLDESVINEYLFFAANEGGQSAFDKLGIDGVFLLTNETYLKSINRRSKESIAMIEKTTQLWIVKTLREALRQGLSSEEIAKLIKSAISRVASERADLISEHELALTMGEIEMEVYRRSGVMNVHWLTAQDERTCEICIKNEQAGSIPIGTLFPSGVLTVPAHQRCRCLILPVIPSRIETIWNGQ